MEKILNAIEIPKLKELLQYFREGYIAQFDPEFTLLILDKDHNHAGSISLPVTIKKEFKEE